MTSACPLTDPYIKPLICHQYLYVIFVPAYVLKSVQPSVNSLIGRLINLFSSHRADQTNSHCSCLYV